MKMHPRHHARRLTPAAAAVLLGALVAGAAVPAAAQSSPAAPAPNAASAPPARGPQGRPEAPPPRDWQRELGVNADVAAKLDATLKAGHERMLKLREQNHQEVAALLTPEQLDKFDRMHRGPGPRGDRGDRHHGPRGGHDDRR